jgi:SAM-dependent methyltransferase
MHAMHKHGSNYIPALSHDWLTPLYDTAIRWTMPEATFKRRLVTEARIERNQRILDLGCGTATLTLLIKSFHHDASVTGIDGDAEILQIGKRKAEKAALDITLAQGMAFDLPYRDSSFDRILSSLMFHHLTRQQKILTMKELGRVLRADGEVHIADFGKPHNLLMRVASFPWQLFDGSTTTADNISGLLPELMGASGFVDVRESATYMTLFGTLSLYAACKA